MRLSRNPVSCGLQCGPTPLPSWMKGRKLRGQWDHWLSPDLLQAGTWFLWLTLRLTLSPDSQGREAALGEPRLSDRHAGPQLRKNQSRLGQTQPAGHNYDLMVRKHLLQEHFAATRSGTFWLIWPDRNFALGAINSLDVAYFPVYPVYISWEVKEVFVTKGEDTANYQFPWPCLGTSFNQGGKLL